MGLLTKVDANALARYCRLWQRWREMEDFIDKHGEVYPTKDRDGKPAGFRQFPQVKIAEKLAAQLTRLEAEFGLTPAARSRVSVEVAAVSARSEELARRFFSS